MTNKKIWVGILAIVLVFGMTVIGCDNGTTNGNGTTDPTVTLSPSTVTINDENLSQTVSVGGTATSQVSINTTALPADVRATLEGTTITVTGVRPITDAPPVTGSPVIVVTREGVSQNLTVNINLTTTWVGNAGIAGAEDGNLSFSNQQVWTFNRDTNTWAEFRESRTEITCWNLGGTGAITYGQFNFSITSIQENRLIPLEDHFDWVLEEGGTVSIRDVRYGRLNLYSDEFGFWRGFGSVTAIYNGFNFIGEEVEFLYVDRAVTVSFPGVTFNYSRTENGFTLVENTTVRAFNVELQQGWNALLWHFTGSMRETATSSETNATETLYVGNPARLRWVIEEWDRDDWSAEAFSVELEGRSFDRHGGLRPTIIRGR